MRDHLPQSREAIAALIPHQGTMCLLERVTECSPDRVVCITATHLDIAHPLKHAGRLASVHLCEYGAQAMAVHGALTNLSDSVVKRPGLLVALRDVELTDDEVNCRSSLEVTAERLQQSFSGSIYAFRVRCNETVLATGRATVMPAPAAPNEAQAT